MSTTLPHGIIQINEGNISWYGDITANWQLIDGKIGIYDAAIATIPAPANNGTLTINYGGTTIAMFGADDAGNVTADIPAPGDGTLTIQRNGTTVDTFTANASVDKTININTADDTKIPLAGSNAISGDLIPSTDGTVNLGGSSYQWNNAYIKSLTINGVACGNILTHNASEFVNVSSNQTIGGQKTFTASPRVTKTSPDIALNISDCDVTEIPTEAKSATLYFRDKNNKNLAYIAAQQRTNGTKRMCLRTHRTDNINNYYSINLDSDGDFYPEQNNTLRLGTPALQWNNTYTRNILIDNDINIASSLINKTSTSGGISICGGLNTQDGASIGLYGKDYNGGIAGNIYMTAYGNSDYTNFRIYPNGTMSVYNNSTATTKNVAMQEDVIPLAGSNAISGSLIPATDNAIDIGSSTNNIKMLYTKGIIIDGTQFSPSDYVLPTGSYIQFAGSQAPAGFLVCNGGAISRTTYSALFAVIGTTYGSGDGSTTFNLPNLTDRFLQGSTTSGTVKNARLPNISGSFNYNCTSTTKDVTALGAISCTSGTVNTHVSGSGDVSLYVNACSFNASNSNSIYNDGATVQPPALTCLICIKY